MMAVHSRPNYALDGCENCDGWHRGERCPHEPKRTDGYDYVRERYGVPVKVGQRVVIDGTEAVVVRGAGDQYLHFKPAGGSTSLIAHPTWRVDYNPPGVGV